jgi:hypothetical protein
MERILPSILPSDLYDRIGTASGPTIVDVRRRVDLAIADELEETHNWLAATVKQARRG